MKAKVFRFVITGLTALTMTFALVSMFMIFCPWNKVEYGIASVNYPAIDWIARWPAQLTKDMVGGKVYNLIFILFTYIFLLVNFIVCIPMCIQGAKGAKLGFGRNIFLAIWNIVIIIFVCVGTIIVTIPASGNYSWSQILDMNKQVKMGTGATWILVGAIISLICNIALVVFIILRRKAEAGAEKKAD